MEYRKKRQKFPLQLTPVEQQDDLTQAFEALKVTCDEPETTKAHWRDWMSDSTWLLIKQRTLLRRAGQLRQSEGRRMQRAIHAALKRDRAVRTARIGETIVTKLHAPHLGRSEYQFRRTRRRTGQGNSQFNRRRRPC